VGSFSDDFSGSDLDSRVWSAYTGEVSGVCSSADNARVSDGRLRLTVRQTGTADCPWTGARVISEDKRYFGYGLVRARIKWNPAAGFWGGFVLWGEARGGRRVADGEVDTEVRNGMVHYRLWSVEVDDEKEKCGVTVDRPNNTLDEWHTFGVNRQSDHVSFFMDGVRRATITRKRMEAEGCTWPFERRFSIALSARAGGWGGTPDPEQYPITTLVDWVSASRPN
jgi:beta-glucanase (GH16 family)